MPRFGDALSPLHKIHSTLIQPPLPSATEHREHQEQGRAEGVASAWVYGRIVSILGLAPICHRLVSDSTPWPSDRRPEAFIA